ncbi:MAG: phosphonate C-P lyase system protein PhnG [Notoacmeibacter sp.]
MSATPAQNRGNPRAEALALLAKASASSLREALSTYWPGQNYRELKPSETGLVMLRGRVGGDGAAFNLGEATVSKAVIELPDGTRGYGQCLGRDVAKAKMAAVLDALWQQEPERVEQLVLSGVRAEIELAKQTKAAQTAATKVDFFTLVRGED